MLFKQFEANNISNFDQKSAETFCHLYLSQIQATLRFTLSFVIFLCFFFYFLSCQQHSAFFFSSSNKWKSITSPPRVNYKARKIGINRQMPQVTHTHTHARYVIAFVSYTCKGSKKRKLRLQMLMKNVLPSSHSLSKIICSAFYGVELLSMFLSVLFVAVLSLLFLLSHSQNH
jgi:hypothetical protein